MKYFRFLVIMAWVGLFAGCAASVPPDELIDARQRYQHATVSLAAELLPAELYKAKEALAAAEKSFQDAPASTRTRDLAYVAERKARLAEALASSAGRKAVTLKANGDYQAIQVGIMNNTVITEAKQRAATKLEQSDLPKLKKGGIPAKSGRQTVEPPLPRPGPHPIGGSTPVRLVTHGPKQDPPTGKPDGDKIARILLVDGGKKPDESVRRMLKSAEYQVVTASGCDNAINLIRNGNFDLILFGVTLSGECSVRILASLKQYQLTTQAIAIRDVTDLERAVKSATLGARKYTSARIN